MEMSALILNNNWTKKKTNLAQSSRILFTIFFFIARVISLCPAFQLSHVLSYQLIILIACMYILKIISLSNKNKYLNGRIWIYDESNGIKSIYLHYSRLVVHLIFVLKYYLFTSNIMFHLQMVPSKFMTLWIFHPILLFIYNKKKLL